MKNEIQQKLEQIALNRSVPFCYGCYKAAPTGSCQTCGSDDLMRLMPEVGCEYGLCRYQHNPHYADNKIMLSLIFF